MKLHNRPLSPHLYSYKPQITSLISIFHRISGFVLSFFLLINCFYFLFVSSFSSFIFCFYLVYMFQLIFFLLYYILCLTLFFHFMNGIRHLLWDFCLGLDIKNLTFSGLLVIFIVVFFILIFIFL